MNNDPTRPIDFIAPRTGEADDVLTPEQEAIAAMDFCALVDDVILANADKVEVSNYTTMANTCNLMFRIQSTDGRKLYINVGTEELELGSQLHKREVMVSESDAERGFQRRHTYSFTPGTHEVKRSDVYRRSEEEERLESAFKDEEYWRKQRQLVESMTGDEFAAAAGDLLSQLRANQAMERQMRLNHLPVSASEVAKLAELIYSADVSES